MCASPWSVNTGLLNKVVHLIYVAYRPAGRGDLPFHICLIFTTFCGNGKIYMKQTHRVVNVQSDVGVYAVHADAIPGTCSQFFHACWIAAFLNCTINSHTSMCA